jgi:hypothetical protein
MKSATQNLFKRLHREYVTNPGLFALRVTVLLLATALLVTKRSIWTPDTLLIIILVVGVVFGRAREFVVRFVPFLGLLIAYDSFRSIADDLNKNVHFTEMINFDRWLAAGQLPTVILQNAWWHGSLQWYDFYLYFIYSIHFLAPVAFALILWKFRPKFYWPFVWSFVLVSFAGFITYVLFPAAPPWMAKELGYIGEPLHRVSSDIWWAMGFTNFSEIYANLSPNEVAAVPSLHSAYPLLGTMFMVAAFGFKKVWWLLVYPLSMWIGVTYLGEHYVVDILVAVLYVVLGYVAVTRFFVWYRQPKRRFARGVNHLLTRLHLA